MKQWLTIKAWLSRLAMSFLILAAVCIWQFSRPRDVPLPLSEQILYAGGAIGCAILAGIGTRAKHK